MLGSVCHSQWPQKTFPEHARDSMSYLTNQRTILFWKKALICDNSVIHTLATINRLDVGLILCKYNLSSININVCGIKRRMWKHLVDVAHDRGQIVFC